MACCIAIALVIAFARTVWYRVVHRSAPPQAGLPPAARRPAPTETFADARTAVPAAPRTTQARRRMPAGAVLGFSAAAGVSAYLAVTEVVGMAGWGSVAAESMTRTGLAALLVGALLAVGVVIAVKGPKGDTARTPLAIAVAGGAWFLFSVLDMHVLGGVAAADGHAHGRTGHTHPGLSHAVLDLIAHGPGLVALAAGALLAAQSRRKAASAQPTPRSYQAHSTI